MANFERGFHFERFIPNLGNNRELQADQLTLELACGMTKVELQRFVDVPGKALHVPESATLPEGATAEQLDASVASFWDTSAEGLATEWQAFVRLGPGTHSING